MYRSPIGRLIFNQAVNLGILRTAAQQFRPYRTSSSENSLLPVVALVGRPNVGKSALFNRFLQRAEALVKNTPDDHVTRDYRQGQGKLGDLQFTIIDTSGLEIHTDRRSIQARTAQLTASILQNVDAALFLVDARDGVTSGDAATAMWLKANVKAPTLLVANKAESRHAQSTAIGDASRLGFGCPIPISAETGEGLVDLYTSLQPILDCNIALRHQQMQEKAIDSEMDAKLNRIAVAVVGVPNAGKSTLLNQLLGKERSLTGPEPGLTRDAVCDSTTFKGHQIDLIDTAGWLNRKRLQSGSLRSAYSRLYEQKECIETTVALPML